MRARETFDELGNHKWRRAMIALALAQRNYDAVHRNPDAPDEVFRRAWLSLWRAERRQVHLLWGPP
jgi:hypothetical protein